MKGRIKAHKAAGSKNPLYAGFMRNDAGSRIKAHKARKSAICFMRALCNRIAGSPSMKPLSPFRGRALCGLAPAALGFMR